MAKAGEHAHGHLLVRDVIFYEEDTGADREATIPLMMIMEDKYEIRGKRA